MSWTSGPEVIVLIRPADSAGNDRGSQALYLLLFLLGNPGNAVIGGSVNGLRMCCRLWQVWGGKRMQRSVEGTSSTGLLPYLQGQAAELLSQVCAFKRLVATQVPVYAYVILSKLDNSGDAVAMYLREGMSTLMHAAGVHQDRSWKEDSASIIVSVVSTRAYSQ